MVLAAGRVSDELLGDLGPIGTSRIPLGGASILARQLMWLCEAFDQVVVTVAPTESKYARLQIENMELRQVGLVEVESSHSLAESLLLGIRALEDVGHPIHVFFGDTLAPAPSADDAVVVAPTPDPDRWALVQRTETNRLGIEISGAASSGNLAVVGVFAFSQVETLARILEERIAAGDGRAFWAALEIYDSAHPLELERAAYWFDVGHIDTYFKTRQQTLGGRAFNSFKGESLRVRKGSKQKEKIHDEVRWYKQLKGSALEVVPTFRATGETGELAWYEMDYVPAVSLGEALVFGELDLGFWIPAGQAILLAHRCLRTASSQPDSPKLSVVSTADRQETCRHLIAAKTEQRLSYIGKAALPPSLMGKCPQIDGRPRPSIEHVLSELDELSFEIAGQSPWGVTHGDFFLGNMLFDRRLGAVKLIDPRGTFGNVENIGPQIYDVAKLSHSVYGRYDFLSANVFELKVDEFSVSLETPLSRSGHRALEELRTILMQLQDELHVSSSLVRRMEAVLLLSAAGLHYESPSRQVGLIASGLIAWDEAHDL